MRTINSILLVAFLAGCARTYGTSPLPNGSTSLSNQPAASQEPAHYRAYESIYSFHGQSTGGSPQASLIQHNGILYGTSSSYGRGYGTVFEMTGFGKLRTLYSFGGYPDGAYPAARLVWFDGALYGTTSAGGAHGGGTVFAINGAGEEHVVHSFGRAGDGAEPDAGLAVLHGVIYGTTKNGGKHGRGTVFAINRSGQEYVLHSFAGSPGDGGHPSTALLVYNGELYGTARAGGKNPAGGAAYKIDAFGDVKLLHSFGVLPNDGSNPAGDLIALNGELYGTTLHGGDVGRGYGTVFSMTPSGSEHVLHSFGAGTDGAFPLAGLHFLNGWLYGTTSGGGMSARKSNQCISFGAATYKCGIIFRIDRFGDERVVYRFKGDPDGANPEAGLTVLDGALYGDTYWGGTSVYYGTIFRILP
ncbi:MAG: choice-of-anchor tandem repeat GloVer-containing protein [Candidatus Baltobacteraceae bacterium]